MRGIDVAGELDGVGVLERQSLLEASADLHQDLATLLIGTAFATGSVAIAATWEGLAGGAGPETDTVEALAYIDHDTDNLSVVLVLESLANRSEHDVQPQVIDVDELLVAEREGPFATVLVVEILPLWADAGLEEMVVGLLG